MKPKTTRRKNSGPAISKTIIPRQRPEHVTIDPVLEQKLFNAYTAVINGESIRKAAKRFATSRTTLTKYLYGERRNKVVAHEYEMSLDVSQENELEGYVKTLTKFSDYVSKKGVYALANQLMARGAASSNAKHAVSPSWIAKFFKRHPLLGHVKPVIFQKPRANDFYGELLAEWRAKLAKFVQDQQIEPSQVYSVAETSYGVGAKCMAVVHDSFKNSEHAPAEATSSGCGSDASVFSAVETACGDGTCLNSFVVLHGSVLEDLVVHHVDEVNSKTIVSIITNQNKDVLNDAQNSYTASELSFVWLKRFDAATRDKHTANGVTRQRVLLVNYNTCHVTLEFFQYCHRNNILPVLSSQYLSSSSSPAKPLVDQLNCNLKSVLTSSVSCAGFLRAYAAAKEAAFSKGDIEAAFAALDVFSSKAEPGAWKNSYVDGYEHAFADTEPLSRTDSVSDEGELTDITVYSSKGSDLWKSSMDLGAGTDDYKLVLRDFEMNPSMSSTSTFSAGTEDFAESKFADSKFAESKFVAPDIFGEAKLNEMDKLAVNFLDDPL